MTNEIIFKTRVDTGTTSKDLAAISTELGKIDEGSKTVGKDSAAQLEALNAKIKAGGMTARQLSKAVSEYMTIARDAGRTSPIGQQAIAEAAILTDELSDLRNEINRAAHDGANMQAALQLGSTVVAGYGAAKGAMSLLGVESESVEQAQRKLIAVTATLNGLEQIRVALEKESFLMMKANALQTKVLTLATAAYSVAVGSSTGALKLFRLALIATGIGAIIVGIGLLITNFDKLKQAVMDGVERFQNMGSTLKNVLSVVFPFIGAIRLIILGLEKMGVIDSKETSEMKKNAEERTKAIQKETEKRRAEINSSIKQNENLRNSINETFDFEIAKAKAAGKDTFELEKQKRAEYRKTLEEQIKLLEQSLIANAGNLAAQMDLLKKMSAARKAITESEQQDELAGIQRSTNARKKALENRKALDKKQEDEAAKALERERLLRDYFIASIADDDVRALTSMQEKHKREREELKKKYGEDTELIKQLESKQRSERMALENEWIDSQKKVKQEADAKELERQKRDAKAALEIKLVQMQDDWEAEMEVKRLLWEMEMEEDLRNEDLTKNEKLLIRANYNKKVRQMEEEDTNRSIEQAKQEREAIDNIMKQSFDAVANLSNAMFSLKLANAEKGSQRELEIQKKQFEANKKIQISQAIIQGIQGLQTALTATSLLPEPLATVQRVANAAAISASTLANVAQIRAQQFQGGGTINPPTIPQVGAPEIPQAPNAQTTQTAGLVNQPNKVVVVDSEIKAVMDSSQQIEVVSSFG